MAKSDLYRLSGHWDHYKEGMFVLGDEEKDKEVFALRPMTCPQPCQRPLITAHGSPVDNIWADLVTVLVNIIHVKLCRQKRIPLDCDHGVFFSVHILGIDINLRAIECRLCPEGFGKA